MVIKTRRLDVIIAEAGYAPNRPASVIICWELVRQHSGLPEATFEIERSLSPAFPDDEVEVVHTTPGVAGQWVYTYVDITPNLMSFWRRYFYRVKVTSGTDVTYSDTRTWETSPRLHELAIIERHDFVLRYIQGTPSFAFIERTADSSPCSCVDVTAGRPRSSDCKLCLGTGKQRPFFDPIGLYVDYNPDSKLTQIASFGELQLHQKDCWFSAYPLLKPGDIIYECMPALLWRIAKLDTVRPMGTTIQQIARIEAIEHSSVEYKRLVQRIPQETLLSLVQEWEALKQERMF